MSLLDEVGKLKQDLVARLEELEPLIREYEQLRELAQRLGVDYTPEPQPASGEPPPSPRPTRRRAAAKKRSTARSTAKPAADKRPGRAKRATPRTATTGARRSAKPVSAATAPADQPAASAGRAGARKRAATRPGQRLDDMLRVVTANPGISVRDVGTQLGVDATGLYRVANKLTADGRLRKDGTKLFAVESATAQTNGDAAARAAQPAAPADASTSKA